MEYGKINDFYLPPAFLRLYDGPSVNVEVMWRILGRGTTKGTIIKPKLGLQPKPFGEVCYSSWQGGDFIKNDEPQNNQVFCQMKECIPEVVKVKDHFAEHMQVMKAMRACVEETGSSKLFSANITADDPEEMIARGKYILSQFGPLSELRLIGWQLHWKNGSDLLEAQLPQAVLALPPSWPRFSDQPSDPAWLHCLRAHQDLPFHSWSRRPRPRERLTDLHHARKTKTGIMPGENVARCMQGDAGHQPG